MGRRRMSELEIVEGDLSVQTSSYGSPIPRVYGTMRVAGTVVWATDLQEEEAIDGGGKGGPGGRPVFVIRPTLPSPCRLGRSSQSAGSGPTGN